MRTHFLLTALWVVGCGPRVETPPPPAINSVPVIDSRVSDLSVAAVRETLPEKDRRKFDQALELSKENPRSIVGRNATQMIQLGRIIAVTKARETNALARTQFKAVSDCKLKIAELQAQRDALPGGDSRRATLEKQLEADGHALAAAETELLLARDAFAEAEAIANSFK